MFPFNSTQPVDFSLYKTGTVAPTPSTNSGQAAPSTTTPPVTAPSTFTTPSGAVVSASGSLLSGPTTSAPQPVTLNADAINNPATLYKVPNAPATPNYGATLASIPTIESITAEKSPDQVAAETQQKSLQDRILGVLGSLGGKGTAEATAEQQAGIPDLQKQLGDVNAQIRTLQAEAQAIPLKDQEDATGRGITAAGLAPIEASKLRLNTIQALGLSAIAATLQGNLGLAQAQVQKQIDAKFDPMQEQLTYLKQALDFNTANMNEEDKKQATLLSAKLQDRQDRLTEAKSDHTKTMSYVLEAAQKGAPAALLSQAQNLPSYQAASVLQQFLSSVQTSRESAVAGLMQQGVNDPARILNYLNYDNNGKLVGDFTAEEVSSIVKNLTAATPKTPKSTTTTGGSTSTFTPTQTNSGAAAANLPIADFEKLDDTTKNYFVNTYKSSQLSKDVSAVITGSLTAGGQNKQQVATNVQSSNLPDAVKQIILKMLGVSSAAAATAPASGGSFWNSALSGIGGALGGIASWLGI